MSNFSKRFLVLTVLFIVCLITSNFFVPRVWQLGHTSLQLPGAVILFPVSYIINDCITEVYGYRKARFVIWLAFATVFTVCLITSNIFVPRTWKLWSLPLQLSGAVVIFPISYIVNDILTEVYGYRKAQLVIWIGLAMSGFVALMAQLVTMLPDPIYPENKAVAESFDSLFRLVPRSTIASLVAFVVGSNINALVMSKMKIASKGKGFGFRAILSTVAGELTDSLIFFPIVFIGTMPLKAVFSIVLTQVAAKTLYEILILPVTAAAVRKVKKIEGIDTFDNGISYNPFRLS